MYPTKISFQQILIGAIFMVQLVQFPLTGNAQDSTKPLIDINNTKLIKKVNSILDSNQKKINNFLFNKVDKAKETLNKGISNTTQKFVPLEEDRPLPYERLLKKKYTLGRRAYQNTLAQFNYLFNGEEELKSFIIKARSEYEDDFTSELIAFYDYELSNTAKNSIDSIVYRANANIVLHDLRSNYVDDSYLLLAKAYLYHKDFDTAASILQFINYSFDEKEDDMNLPIGSNLRNNKKGFSIATPDNNRAWENENIRNESLLWRARVYFETGELNEGISLLQILKSDPVFPKQLHPFLYEQMAYGYYQMELYDSAARYLIEALPNAPDQFAKSRWHFLIAQLWQKKEQWKDAYTWYKKANESSINPIVSVYSKINMTRIDAKNANRPWLELAQDLERMGKREKFSLYKDIIYFEMAKLALQNNDFDKANDWLVISVKKNVSNFSQKQKAFELLAAINYTKDQYRLSKMAYDSVTTILKSNPHFEQVVLRKKWMESIESNQKVILEQDTLQYIFTLPVGEQVKFNDEWQKRTNDYYKKINTIFFDNSAEKKKEDELNAISNLQASTLNNNSFGNTNFGNIGMDNNGFPNTNFNNSIQSNNLGRSNLTKNNTGNNSDFYFENKNLLQQGKQLFIRKWGERPNIDQWRRKSSTSMVYNGNKNAASNSNLIRFSADTSKKDSIPNLSGNPIINVPLLNDSTELNASKLKWNLAVLKNAQIFLLELNDFEKAYPLYKKLIVKNIEPEITERALLDLASHYIHINKPTISDSIIKLVETNFPVGFYASKKNQQQLLSSKEKEVINVYNEAYFLSQIGHWDSLSKLAITLNQTLKGTQWNTPFQFLKVKMYAQQRMDSVALVLLDSIVLMNQSERIRDKAKNIITEIKRRKETEAYLANLKIAKQTPLSKKDDSTVQIIAQEMVSKESSTEKKTTAVVSPTLSTQKESNDSLQNDAKLNLIEPITRISFTLDSTEQYYAAILTNKVKPMFVKEIQTAFNYLNIDEFKKQNLSTTFVQFDDEAYIVWIGPFKGLTEGTQYLQKVKPRLTTEIISFVKPNQYEIYLLGKSNILIIKDKDDLDLYKIFMHKNIYK